MPWLDMDGKYSKRVLLPSVIKREVTKCGVKYFQHISLSKGFYPEYIKHSYKLIRQKNWIEKRAKNHTLALEAF